MPANVDLAMMRIAGLDAADRGDFAAARRMEDALRLAGRADLAEEICAAGVTRGFTLRAKLAAGADTTGGSRILAARELAASH